MTRLNYATASRYHHRRSGRRHGVGQLAVLAVIIGGSAALFRFSLLRPDPTFVRVWFGICGIVGVVGVLHSLQLIYHNGLFECRIEGGKLYLQSGLDAAVQVIDLADVTEFATVTSASSNDPAYHLRLKDGQDLRLEQRIIGYVGRFSRALKAENPAIRITHEP